MSLLSAEALKAKFAGLQLLSLDTDGVLTDGGLYYTDDGDELRKFNVKDGLGIKRVQAAGVPVAIISASRSPSIYHRAQTLGIEHVHLANEDKLGTLTTLCSSLGIDLASVAHVGDDLNDLPVFGAVGCPMTVADAVQQAKDAAVFVAEKRGGEGAVREICDMIVAAKSEG